MTQGPVVAKEPPQKILHMPAPDPKSLCGKALLHLQVVGEFFLFGMIDRRRRRNRAQTLQEIQPTDRAGKNTFTALLAIYVVSVPEARPEPLVNCCLNGFNTDGP
jgi:hypothetical protein